MITDSDLPKMYADLFWPEQKGLWTAAALNHLVGLIGPDEVKRRFVRLYEGKYMCGPYPPRFLGYMELETTKSKATQRGWGDE